MSNNQRVERCIIFNLNNCGDDLTVKAMSVQTVCKGILQTCADPESFTRVGPTLTRLFFSS